MALDTLSYAPEIQLDPAVREFANSVVGPETMDLLVTTRCQEDCLFCFKPEDLFLEISRDEWLRIIYLSHLMSVRGVTFTGGEPLLLDYLPDLLRYARYLGLKTTLSTNALLLLQRHEEVMPFVDEIGIPIDGPTPKQNALMRRPNGMEQFHAAIDAIGFIQSRYPGVEITIRTVVTKLNYMNVLRIPFALKRMGIDLSEGEIRWKLYQFDPIGDQFGEALMSELCISTAEFLDLWANLRALKFRCEFFPTIVQTEAYSLVYPNGDLVTAVLDPQRPSPYDFPLFRYRDFGNLVVDFINTMSLCRREYEYDWIVQRQTREAIDELREPGPNQIY